jgi:hypothetical protein
VAPKAKAPKTKAQPSKAKASPKGLQLSAAQWKAYNAAYTASATAGYRRLAIQASAQTMRQSRLTAVYTLGKKVAAAHAAARTAAIAAFAVKQSFRQSQLAHQNAALHQRVYADYIRHVLQAARLQYVYKGEKAYLHTAVMSTVTSAQALSATQARFAQAAKTAKAAAASTTAKGAASAKLSPASAQVQATAKAAALAAAKATPKGRTAPRPVLGDGILSARLRGDPEGFDCVAAAVANHLQSCTGHLLTDRQYRLLQLALGYGPSIEEALKVVSQSPPWGDRVPALAGYAPVPVHAREHAVIGFATARGAHAAYCPGPAYIASWGELLELHRVILPETQVEEAWALLWK